jgi:FkbM family methyltransferase
MSESVDGQTLYELESILHSLVANDTTILDALAQMLNAMQQMQARSEQSQNKLSADVGELMAEVRKLSLELIERREGTAGPQKPVVMTEDEFAGQNPELGLLEYLYSYLTNTNAIDVGANVGRVSERLLKCGYSVYAFEPYGPSFRALRERLSASQKFHAFDFALGPADGTMNLHIASDLSGVSKWDPSLFHSLIARPMLQDLQFTQTVPVQVRSLESLRRNGEIPEGAGLLKIDTEGFDLEVMRGMGDGHFSVVMSEFWDAAHPFGRFATSRLEDLVREMKCRGYDWYIVIYHLDESSTISYYCNRAQTVPNSWGNAVFFGDHAIFAKALRWCEEVLVATLYR